MRKSRRLVERKLTQIDPNRAKLILHRASVKAFANGELKLIVLKDQAGVTTKGAGRTFKEAAESLCRKFFSINHSIAVYQGSRNLTMGSMTDAVIERITNRAAEHDALIDLGPGFNGALTMLAPVDDDPEVKAIVEEEFTGLEDITSKYVRSDQVTDPDLIAGGAMVYFSDACKNADRIDNYSLFLGFCIMVATQGRYDENTICLHEPLEPDPLALGTVAVSDSSAGISRDGKNRSKRENAAATVAQLLLNKQKGNAIYINRSSQA